MPAERGYFLLNVIVGFSLLVGAIFVAGLFTESAFPPTAEPRAYACMLVLCSLPFFLFYRWAKPTGVPLWKEFLFFLVSFSGILAIQEILIQFGNGTKWWRWLPLAGLAWGILCHSLYDRWVRTNPPTT